MTALPRPLARAIALLLLFALLGLFHIAVVSPILVRYQAASLSVTQSRRLLAHYRTEGADPAPLLAERDRLKSLQAESAAFLKGRHANLVAADLQGWLQKWLESSGGRLSSVQALPPEAEGEFDRIGIRADMRLGLPALQAVLYSIESSTPFLFVDNLDIRTVRQGVRNREDGTDELMIRLDLYGYMRSERQ